MLYIPDFNFHYHFSENYTLVHTKTGKAITTDSYMRYRAIRRNDNKAVNADRHYLLATVLKPYPHSDKAVVNWLTDKQDIFDLDSWEWSGYYTGFIPEDVFNTQFTQVPDYPRLYVDEQARVCNEQRELFRARLGKRNDLYVSNVEGRGSHDNRVILVRPLMLLTYFGLTKEALLSTTVTHINGNYGNCAKTNLRPDREFLTDEELKEFKLVPDNYPLAASKDGEICNVETRIKLKPVVTKTYHVVSNKKTGKNVKVHRLVMAAWEYREDYNNLQVNHKDGNKLNNDLANLEWVTAYGNMKHARETELMVSKFTVVIVTDTGYLRFLSMSQYSRYLKQCPFKTKRALAKRIPDGVYLIPGKDKNFIVNGVTIPLATIPIKSFNDDVKVTDCATGKVSLFSCQTAAIEYFHVSKWKVTNALFKQIREVIDGKVFEWLKPE